LAAFWGALIFGQFGSQIGPKFLVILGAFIQAICVVAFGFLNYIQNTAAFLGLCYLLR
jgi:hypothetical protein